MICPGLPMRCVRSRAPQKRDSAGPGLSRIIVDASTDITVTARNLSAVAVGRAAKFNNHAAKLLDSPAQT